MEQPPSEQKKAEDTKQQENDDSSFEPKSIVLVGEPAPDFTCQAVQNNEVKTIKLSDFRGKEVILCFYPSNEYYKSNYGNPKQTTAFRRFIHIVWRKNFYYNYQNHKEDPRKVWLLGCSVDSVQSHQKLMKQNSLTYEDTTLISDVSKQISKQYGCLCQKGRHSGKSLEAFFIISKEGIIKRAQIYDSYIPFYRDYLEDIHQHFDDYKVSQKDKEKL